MYFYLSVVSMLILFSCKAKQKEEDGNVTNEKTIYEIDLSKDFTGSTCDNLLLSDIVEDVEYVQLETTDDCLIGAGFFCAFTEKDIYVLNTNYKNEELFRFDRATGKFIRKIGQIGQGPKDMMRPDFIYAGNNYVYASSSIMDKVYVYDENGGFVRTIPLRRGWGGRITVIQNKYIIHNTGWDFMVRSDDDGSNSHEYGSRNLYIAANIQDMEGNTILAKCDTLQGEKPSVNLDFNPIRWYYNGELNFYDEVDNIIYAANENGFTPRYKLKLGENRWVETGKLTKEFLKYIKIHYFQETADYLFIYWNQREKAYFARFNKKTEVLEVEEEDSFKGRFWHLYAYGPKNDIDGCETYFRQGCGNYEDITGSILFTITPDNIDRVREALEKAENVKFPEKRQQLLKMLDERKEDDNPILVIYKLKK